MRKIIWIRQILEGMNFKIRNGYVTIIQDNQGAIKLAENAVYSQRTKHIDVKFHFIRKLVNEGKIKLQYINTKSMLADGLTKALSGQRMDELLNGMRIKKVES